MSSFDLRHLLLVGCALPVSGACGDDGGRQTSGTITTSVGTSITTSPGTDGSGDPSGTSGTSSGSATSGTSGTSGPSTDGATTTGTSATSSDTNPPKFDVGNEKDIPGAGEGSGIGCKKIDFLFVVDNSGSMQGEQQNLANSFPGFISTIQNQVMAQDFQILVMDTDAGGGGGGCFQSTCCNANCATWCQNCLASGCTCQCNNMPCPPPPGTGECDITLGAGKTQGSNGADCGITGGNRYMIDGQPNLTTTFQCLAQVGTNGDGNERPMQAMLEGVTTLDQPGKCNEGFLRDDALLVITVITDEEDSTDNSPGNPMTWKQTLVTAKNGDENAIVALAIIGDTGLPNATCGPLMGNNGAENAPRIRQWAESFKYGSWGSICAADYTPFFQSAVTVIDTACDDFVPPG